MTVTGLAVRRMLTPCDHFFLCAGRTHRVAHRHVPYTTINVRGCPHCQHPGGCQTRRGERAIECHATVDRGSGPQRTLLPWHRRRACRSIQEEHPCRTGSAHESVAVSLCTSRQRSTAASSVVPSTLRVTSVCAIKHAELLRDRYRCCVSCVLISHRRRSTPRHSSRSCARRVRTCPPECPASPAESTLSPVSTGNPERTA